MVVETTVKIVGMDKLKRDLRVIQREIKNDSRLQSKFANKHRQRMIQNIKSGRGSEGSLRPLKAMTLRRRQTEGNRVGGTRPLIESGRMIRSIKSTTRRLGKNTRTEIQPSRDQALKAGVHQFGSRRRGIPARPFMGFNSRDEAELKKEYTNHIKKALKKR